MSSVWQWWRRETSRWLLQSTSDGERCSTRVSLIFTFWYSVLVCHALLQYFASNSCNYNKSIVCTSTNRVVAVAGVVSSNLSACNRKRQTAKLMRWCRGTMSWWRLAERSHWRLAASVVDLQQSTTYWGALPCRHRWTVTPSLNWIHWGTSSQWSICVKPSISSCMTCNVL